MSHLKTLKPCTFQKESVIAWGLSAIFAGPERSTVLIKYPIFKILILLEVILRKFKKVKLKLFDEIDIHHIKV